MTCKCGCGQAIADNRQYAKGHNIRNRVGSDAARWAGGINHTTSGYVMRVAVGHPRAGRRGYVMEHVLLAEAAIGHYLPPRAEVHHVDENKSNNSPDNLVVCEGRAYHMLLHQRQRALTACGNPGAIRCDMCKSYERQDDITERQTSCGGRRGYHRSCNAARRRRVYAASLR